MSSSAGQGVFRPRYVDIGVNLADPVFRGNYHGQQRHPDDLKAVIQRAHDVGCQKLIVTGSSFRSSEDAIALAREFPGVIYTTAGIHPCDSSVFRVGQTHGPQNASRAGDDDGLGVDPAHTQQLIARLSDLVDRGRQAGCLVALGEFGLDYDRLHYCPRALQQYSFARQLELAASLTPQLPLFLHNRAAASDFVAQLRATFGARLERLHAGAVVHSFTGTRDEMRELADLGLYIGVNGCSVKTADNCAVVRDIPRDRLMLETDAPWCEVRPSHEGWKFVADPTAPRYPSVKKEKWKEGAMVKSRNEPCSIERVAEIVARIREVSVEEVCEAAWRNTVKLFSLQDEEVSSLRPSS